MGSLSWWVLCSFRLALTLRTYLPRAVPSAPGSALAAPGAQHEQSDEAHGDDGDRHDALEPG
jgi:hypothetical protein